MNTDLLTWNRVVSPTGTFAKIISGRDPKFTLALWKNLHKLFGTKLSFSTGYHPQTNGLAKGIMQKLEEMVRGLCAYGLELRDCNLLTHDWCTLLPELELAYKIYVNASTNPTPDTLEER
ncbi:hypothetical protein O181_018370 [Austropuccinia psidii MF-1]|uniref:Integrase catalytic domain-containing protein n=1 Tax=Austropuccinia psidii MF-1 TaxID=1389203 RepID=A0A9Q3C8M8_9BASI|nr:hypothetical protein [Austropuccinia psidii MF-1]